MLTIALTALLAACGSGRAGEQHTPAGRSPPDPFAGKTTAQFCADDSLVLVKWDFDQAQRDFHRLCCGKDGLGDDLRCELDWPFSDVPSCTAWASLRNGIYARYGYPFTKAEWQKTYAATPWYERREDFEASWLPAVAAANVEKLKQLEKDHVGCQP